MRIKDFATSKKYRKISYVFFLLAAVYLACFEEVIGAVIILTFAVYFGFQYKCPHCQRTLDTRNAHRNIKYCPYCGKWLDKQ